MQLGPCIGQLGASRPFMALAPGYRRMHLATWFLLGGIGAFALDLAAKAGLA